MHERYLAYLDALNRRDVDEAMRFVAPTLRHNGHVVDSTVYANAIRSLFAAFPDFHWEVETFIADGERCSVVLRDSGTHTGSPYLGYEPSGVPVQTFELATYTWSGDRITEVWSAAENELIRGQLDARRTD